MGIKVAFFPISRRKSSPVTRQRCHDTSTNDINGGDYIQILTRFAATIMQKRASHLSTTAVPRRKQRTLPIDDIYSGLLAHWLYALSKKAMGSAETPLGW